MLLKLVTRNANGTKQDDYIPMKSKFSVTYPAANGSFGANEFGYDQVTPPVDTVAVIHWPNGDNSAICVHKDQGAYIISEEGVTNTVINKLEEPVVWYRNSKVTTIWNKLTRCADKQVWHMREKNVENSDYEFLEVKAGLDPNKTKQE